MPTLRCQGCGREVPGDSPSPWRCPASGDGGDHVLLRTLPAAPGAGFPTGGDDGNPFLRYRKLTLAHALALSRGLTDREFASMVEDLDAAVARIDGHGFTETPFGRSAALSDGLGFGAAGGVLVKDETGNVSGSHKARHLMGLALVAEVQLRTGVVSDPAPRLAIASCGNAALAAAVIAAAWGRGLDVFIPTDANPRVVARLQQLGASVQICKRDPGVPGDPCYHAFLRAVERGALPFCCQGSDNGLTIEGGETLAWELVSVLLRERLSLDRLFVQVGGGALASACVQGFRDAALLGVPIALPRLHPVQTRGAFPLRRAWEKVAARLAARLGIDNRLVDTQAIENQPVDSQHTDAALAEAIRARASLPEGRRALDEELGFAAAHRAQFMWPWETAPHSVAHGILDDETYDWLAIVRGTLESGGFPVLVSEELLLEAHALGGRAGFQADATGTAGLAGLLALRREGTVGSGEAVAVLFTGRQR